MTASEKQELPLKSLSLKIKFIDDQNKHGLSSIK